MPVVLHLGKDRHAKSTGFTLVEMLVVIAISALLSALLLPSLSTAKEKSMRAVCKNNIKELLMVMEIYSEENADLLPGSADNYGLYHSIILSDNTFSNLLLLTGTSNIFYCPNIVFGDTTGSVAQHSSHGYVIGYSYWAGYIADSSKTPDYEVLPTKSTDTRLNTNALISDANYWTSDGGSPGYFPPAMAMAPHSALGAAMARGSSFTVGLGTNSASIGAQGGNAGYFPGGSVVWRSIDKMQKLPASSQDDAYGIR